MAQTCLIIEDHENLRGLLCEWLGVAFPQVSFLGAASAEDALNLIRTKNAEVVLLDLDLPGMTGIEAARIIKRRYPQTFIIIHTIYDEAPFRHAALSTGADAFVSKNKSQTELLPILNSVFAV